MGRVPPNTGMHRWGSAPPEGLKNTILMRSRSSGLACFPCEDKQVFSSNIYTPIDIDPRSRLGRIALTLSVILNFVKQKLLVRYCMDIGTGGTGDSCPLLLSKSPSKCPFSHYLVVLLENSEDAKMNRQIHVSSDIGRSKFQDIPGSMPRTPRS